MDIHKPIKQLCCKALGGPGRQESEHESVGNEDKPWPGLQWVKGCNSSTLFSACYCVQFWSPHISCDPLKTGQRRATRMIRELENNSYEEKLKELDFRRKGSEDLV